MKIKMFSIYDVKSEIHHPPHYCHTTGHAIRHFTTLFSQQETTFAKFPEDFRVMEVGEFDDQTGKVTPKEPHLIAQGTELGRKDNYGAGTKVD